MMSRPQCPTTRGQATEVPDTRSQCSITRGQATEVTDSDVEEMCIIDCSLDSDDDQSVCSPTSRVPEITDIEDTSTIQHSIPLYPEQPHSLPRMYSPPSPAQSKSYDSDSESHSDKFKSPRSHRACCSKSIKICQSYRKRQQRCWLTHGESSIKSGPFASPASTEHANQVAAPSMVTLQPHTSPVAAPSMVAFQSHTNQVAAPSMVALQPHTSPVATPSMVSFQLHTNQVAAPSMVAFLPHTNQVAAPSTVALQQSSAFQQSTFQQSGYMLQSTISYQLVSAASVPGLLCHPAGMSGYLPQTAAGLPLMSVLTPNTQFM